MTPGELRLVEVFEELKPGVRIEFRCQRRSCASRHEAMVFRIGDAFFLGPHGAYVLPVPPCVKAGGFVVVPADVTNRRVFRWIDFDPACYEERADSLALAREQMRSAVRGVLLRAGIREA